MQRVFRPYQPRKIQFQKIILWENWKIKLYTITTKESFTSSSILATIKEKLSSLFGEAKDHHNSGFIIIHEGTDGVWTLSNWWTDKEMLRTNTYFTDYQDINCISLDPKTGSMACVWELPIINHEKDAWVKHILKQVEEPDFDKYFKDILEGNI